MTKLYEKPVLTTAVWRNQANYNKYRKQLARYEEQQARLAAGLPAKPKKEVDYVYITTLAKTMRAQGEGRVADAMLKVAKEYGIKTIRKSAITLQEGGTSLTNWEGDRWSIHYKERSDDKMLGVKTDTQETMHAGSNRMWKIGESRIFEAGVTAFRVTYNYAASGAQYSMHIYMFTEVAKELKSGDMDGMILDSGR